MYWVYLVKNNKENNNNTCMYPSIHFWYITCTTKKQVLIPRNFCFCSYTEEVKPRKRVTPKDMSFFVKISAITPKSARRWQELYLRTQPFSALSGQSLIWPLKSHWEKSCSHTDYFLWVEHLMSCKLCKSKHCSQSKLVAFFALVLNGFAITWSFSN